MKKLIRCLFEEEDSSQCLKILSQFTVKKTKVYQQRFETFCQRENERFLRQICDPPQDFNAKGESTRTTRFHFKTKEFEQKSVLKFSNKSPVRKSTTRFQCAQKHARRVIYKLNKFPLQKGTTNDYERHPFFGNYRERKSSTSAITAIVSD